MNRRDLFSFAAHGLGATAAFQLLFRDGVIAATHHAAKAKRAVQITLVGGLSHVDSFDPKPMLAKHHGEKLKTDTKPDVFFNQVGLLRRNDWEFKPRGKSGLQISELFPHIAGVADELAVIRSMTADSANHTPALFVLNSGFQFNGYPSLGGWLSYGLGSLTDDLPAYVVLPDGRGEANGAASNWTSGFLPAQHQGVVFRGGTSPVNDLFPETPVSAKEEKDSREFLEKLNGLHLEKAGGEADLAARMKSYALAAKMQLAVPAVADLSKESEKTKSLYGFDRPDTADCAKRCLLARRLLERGVRFVQIYSGGPIAGSPRTSWDAHENVKENHGAEAKRIDQPVAALVKDLRDRGMLDDTLVLFTTEFGRTPFAQSAEGTVGPGRDHNKYAFSCWLAGAGVKAGTAFGSTDDIGWKVAEHPVAWYDFHATVLHLFGIDHEKLTYYHNGIKRRLTNVHGEVVKGVLA
jgi:hypothetical protein